MNIRCIIIDDEPIARQVIANHLESFENIEIVAECKNAIKAFEILKNEKIDLMFLDIQMPQITGYDFLKTLSQPPKVIITTAYRDYAIEGYELDVLDYLLKPISFERFLKAINKYYNSLETTSTIQSIRKVPDALPDFIYIRENKKNRKIVLSEIQYLESLREYVRIHTKSGKFITKESLAHFETLLPSNSFIRIHKSFIVSLAAIKSFTSNAVELDGIELPISRSYKLEVLKALGPV